MHREGGYIEEFYDLLFLLESIAERQTHLETNYISSSDNDLATRKILKIPIPKRKFFQHEVFPRQKIERGTFSDIFFLRLQLAQ